SSARESPGVLQSASAATGLTPLARIVSTSHRDHRVFPDLPRPRARISRRRAASSPMFIIAFVCIGQSPFDRPIRHPLGANNSCAFHARGHEPSWSALRDFMWRGGTHSGRCRDRRGTSAGQGRDTRRQQKTLIHQCTVGAGPLARSTRTARRRRPSAKCERSANIPVLVRAVAPHGRRAIGKWFPIQTGRRACRAARHLVSMTRQPTEKEYVMSFEEMAENAKAPSLPTEFKFEESPVRIVMKGDQPWFVTKDV